MYDLYCGLKVPQYLDANAKSLLQEARTQFKRFYLDQTSVIGLGNQSLLFCWHGDIILNTLLVLLTQRGLKASRDGIAIAVSKCSPEELIVHIDEIAHGPMADPVVLASSIKNKKVDKYDYLLNDDLLCRNYAMSQLDVSGAWTALKDIKQRF